jgi:quinol-cytochrome oxidoreductase complex cytochrome b subunit
MNIRASLLLHVHPKRVPQNALLIRFTWCAGGLSALLFGVLVISGALLALHYRPTPEHAFDDVRRISKEVPFGWLFRNVHRWAGDAMVAMVGLHMLRVFATGSYRPPRELNWIVGVLLLWSTLLMAFTGYLLPWDQLSYWAVTVGLKMLASVPFVGADGPFSSWFGVGTSNDLRALIIGGQDIGSLALARFYLFHCLGLPGLAGLLMVWHFWRIRRDGGISAPL